VGEVERVFPTRIGGYAALYAPPNAVAFKLRDGPQHQPSRSERISRWLMHADEMIPGLYERSATDIAELMERYRRRYSTAPVDDETRLGGRVA
jgi:hypothetical protein